MLTTLFVDMNAYFASVEQEVRPSLRGKPVGIVATLTDYTCCIAASYEAKKMGVKTGTGVIDAKRLCPEIRIIEARPELYVRYHHQIVAAVESCIHVDTVMSIDEMACRLMGSEREPENAMTIGYRIKAAIRNVGETLRCSIGIAPNRVLAKVASDMQKPDGMTVITLADLPHKLYPLELEDLPGVGKRMHARLRLAGICTVEQLCARRKIVWRRSGRACWEHVGITGCGARKRWSRPRTAVRWGTRMSCRPTYEMKNQPAPSSSTSSTRPECGYGAWDTGRRCWACRWNSKTAGGTRRDRWGTVRIRRR